MATTPAPEYTYRGSVLRWVDGDTVDLHIDLGFHMYTDTRFRLYGIDTPERGAPNYAAAGALAAELAPVGGEVLAKTYKAADKYGRWLVEIWAGEKHVNSSLIDAGLAKPYFGGTK